MIGPFGHLGADACALADGTLDEARAARAQAHLATCEQCAAAVREQRRQRRLTASLGDVEVPLSLQERLLALTADDAADVAPATSAPWGATPRRAPGRLVAVAAVSVLGVGIAASGSLMVIGATRTTSPEAITSLATTDPGDGDGTAEPTRGAAAITAISTAGQDATAWPVGWTSPLTLPSGAVVTGVHDLPSGDLRVDLDVDGEGVVVLESHGVLRLTDADITRSVRVGELEVHLIGDWWMTQAGDEIVAVSAADDDVSLAVIREFDSAGSTGVLGSISRGWQVIAGG